MQIFPLILTIFFSSFSTAVMGYISMATPIGPWIAPTIVLCALLVFKLFAYKNTEPALGLVAAGSSVGGIIATACGFSYPTLYFLNPELFNAWLSTPLYFVFALTSLAFVAGALGMIGANLLETQLIEEQELSFPIGQLVYKMITAGNQLKKAIELFIGFVSTTLFCIVQDGIQGMAALLPRAITLVTPFNIAFFAVPRLNFDLWPMLWAIGFVTGHVIAAPLAVGALLKIILVDPVNSNYFAHLSSIEFVLAFCSGMVLYGAIVSFVSFPKLLAGGIKWIRANGISLSSTDLDIKNNQIRYVSWMLAIGLGVLFLWHLNFSFSAMLFLYAASFACMYQVAVIAGKIGLAPLGRFATFVMVPAMLLFGLNFTQIVVVATFVEISSGVVADMLFGRKMAHLLNLDRRMVVFYQLVGLLVSSVVVGIVFWLLISRFQLGSAELLAYKAQSRQLLINARQFDIYVLILGALCSFGLKYLKVNPMLALGGLLMPLNISIGLIFGGCLTFLTKDRERWEPFWSGVFAANSIWMLIQALF